MDKKTEYKKLEPKTPNPKTPETKTPETKTPEPRPPEYPMTREQEKEVNKMVNRLINAAKKMETSKLQCHDIANLLQNVKPIFQQQPMLVEIPVPISVCGDIHGQLADLVQIFERNKWPDKMRYLFLGDYVDRGPNSIDTICLLLALKIRYPEEIYLLRGNHETKAVNEVYGFKAELQQRFPPGPGPDGKQFDFGTELWRFFNRVFDYMPLAALVDEQVLCMHGGLSPDLKDLNQIRQLKRPLSKFPDRGLEVDLLWADPDKEVNGFVPSPRGISYNFGADAVASKLEELGLAMIVRAHQVVQEGYELFAGDRLVTVFSAPNYCGQFKNHGGVMGIKENLCCKMSVLKSKESPVQAKPPNETDKKP